MNDQQRGQTRENPLDFDAAARVLRDVYASDHAESEVPGYVIDRLVGQGGGGTVYRAFRLGSDQAVALKVLSAAIGSGAVAARVWREIDLLESLRIPGVARLLDHGTHQGRVYIATEFIEGQTLAEAMAALKDPHARAGVWAASVREMDVDARANALVDLVAKMADAVQSIHERGVIHRDIKPGNVIVMDDATPVLVDFGLARLQEDPSQTLTTEGAAIGTPAFMSPEQARGERGQISTRSDVWSLAATACWMLTGAAPFDTDCSLHEALRRVGQEMPRHPALLRDDLPRSLAAVIAKALSRQSEARYASAGQFADDLRRWRRGEPVTAAPMSRWQRAASWIGRHPIVGTAVASSLVGVGILVGVAGFVAWGLMKPMRIEKIGNNQGVAIVSGFGTVLEQWDAGQDYGIANNIVRTNWGGRRYLIVGFMLPPIGHKALGTNVVAFDFDTGEAIWSSADPSRRIRMPSTGGATGVYDTYSVSQMCAADVFADVDGLELIVLHQNQAHSGSCIRVYTLDGEILSEVWHDGQPKDVYWIADVSARPGALGMAVVVGVNSERPYSAMGVTDARQGAGVPVLFGWRPERGRFGWIATPTEPNPLGDDDATPAWYRYLCPPRWASMLNAQQMYFTVEHGDPTAPARLGINLLSPTGDVVYGMGPFWRVGQDGPLGPAVPGDAYLERKDVPPVEVWTWSEWPY